jgi:hypothetical protein
MANMSSRNLVLQLVRSANSGRIVLSSDFDSPHTDWALLIQLQYCYLYIKVHTVQLTFDRLSTRFIITC